MGRETERALLRAELEAALEGEGRLVLLVGEPGIGKTRTASALAAEARECGASVVWGRCHERAGAPVYWPVVQALASYAADAPAATAEAIAAVLPLLRAPEAAAAPDGPPERARFELFDRVGRALAAAARARPLFLAIDDLHWADVGSLLLLEFLARELGTLPLLVVATLRDLEPQDDAKRAALLAAVVRLGTSVPLAGLERSAVEELLADRLGHPPGDDVVERVLGVTEGNPFFVIELAHLLAARGGSAAHGPLSAVPPGVQELLRQRLEPLATPSLRLLEAAAVVGRGFELGPLALVLKEPPGALLDALRAPLALGLVREIPGTLRRYAFSHALLREALYQRLAPAARSALHGAVAEALEATGPADEERLPALAHHFFEAAQATDPAKAIRYGCEAGLRALRLLAFEEAVRHFERVLAALAVAGDDSSRLRALTGLGEALRGMGDPAGADAAFHEAVGLARRRGGAALADTILRFARARAELSVLDVEMNALLEEALAAAPTSEPLRARLLARLAVGLHLQPGAEARRKALSDEALALARGLGDPTTLGFVLSRRLVGLLGPDALDERLATADEILRTGTPSHGAELEALGARVDALAERGDRGGLDCALAIFEQKARASREPFSLWTATSLRAALALLEGRYAEAEVLAGEALAIGRGAQTRTPLLRFAQQLFSLRGWQGRLAEVEPLVRAGAAETQVVPAWRCALAQFYVIAGREAEARSELDALAAGGFADLPRDSTWLTVMSLLANVCARLGDVPRAALLYDLLWPYAGRVAVSRFSVLLAPIDQRLGMLAGLLGRYDAAEEHFAGALALAERMRALPWQAETRYHWAEMLRRRAGRGDRERALALLDEAEAEARAVGMALLVGWIAECRAGAAKSTLALAVGAKDAHAVGSSEARRGAVVTLVPRAPDASAMTAPRAGTLRRDGEVWSLVFEGRTTRLRHMLGLVHLARLVAEPGREVHAADLAAAAYEGRRDPGGAAPPGDAGELLDARARTAYATRLRDAREELEEAERRNDRGQVERLGEEIERLAAELSRGFGLGGRPRRAGSAAERARLSVTRAIRYAIDKIGEHDPALAEHLRLGVRTGAFCVYAPSSRDPVSWTR